MIYTAEQKAIAREKDVPLVKIEIDFRHAKEKTKRYRRQSWGTVEKAEIMEMLNKVMREMM